MCIRDRITNAAVNDVNAMDVIPYESGAYYIFYRGYVDFKRLYNITKHSAYFVIRAKKNLQFQFTQMNPVNERNGVMSNQIGKLTGFYIYHNTIRMKLGKLCIMIKKRIELSFT